MAYGDYIPCCKCDVKLIYDGDRSQRNWWVERFGKEPEIECPNCKAAWVGLTDEERKQVRSSCNFNQIMPIGEYAEAVQKATEAKLKEKNT
jgi:hypothetical protein